MPYRTKGHAAHFYELPQPLTLRQSLQVLYRNAEELMEHRWYRQHLGGLWCQTSTPNYTIPTLNPTTGIWEARPLWEFDNGRMFWYQLPEAVLSCLHEDERKFTEAINATFPEDYQLFTKMWHTYRMLRQERESSGVAVCRCEKYRHRRKEKE